MKIYGVWVSLICLSPLDPDNEISFISDKSKSKNKQQQSHNVDVSEIKLSTLKYFVA